MREVSAREAKAARKINDEANDEANANSGASLLDELRLDALMEGQSVQTLHIGPYDDEGPVIVAMHEHAAERGLQLTGTHHEIYLGDPRRVAPEKLRAILRQPVR